MTTLVLLDSSDIAAGYMADAARALGLSPFYLCDLASYAGDPLARILREPHLGVDTWHLEHLIELVRARCGAVVAVTTLADSRLDLAVALAQAIGARGLDPAVRPLKDKARVAELLREFSPPTVAFAREAPPLDQIGALFDDGSKVIVKPTHGAGAVGVFVLHDRDELATLPEQLARRPLPAHLDSGRHIAQRFVPGALVSAEGYALGGAVTVLGYTDRAKVLATESRAGFPAQLSPAATEAGARALHELVRRSGFANGYFHVEFIVDGGHVWLVDANVGRVGGGPIGDLLSLSYGVPPEAIYRHVLEVSLFHRETENPYGGRRQDAYSILYGLARGGPVDRVEATRPLSARHTVLLDRGAVATPMGSDDWSWVGILTGLREQTLADIEAIRIWSGGRAHAPCY